MGDNQFNGTQEEWDALVKKNKYKTMTAVEWLFQKLWDEPKDKFTWYAIRAQALEMERGNIR